MWKDKFKIKIKMLYLKVYPRKTFTISISYLITWFPALRNALYLALNVHSFFADTNKTIEPDLSIYNHNVTAKCSAGNKWTLKPYICLIVINWKEEQDWRISLVGVLKRSVLKYSC